MSRESKLLGIAPHPTTSCSGRLSDSQALLFSHALKVADSVAAAGAVVATTTTDLLGTYRFDQPGLGAYTVRVLQTGQNAAKTITITKGQSTSGVDLTLSLDRLRAPLDSRHREALHRADGGFGQAGPRGGFGSRF